MKMNGEQILQYIFLSSKWPCKSSPHSITFMFRFVMISVSLQSIETHFPSPKSSGLHKLIKYIALYSRCILINVTGTLSRWKGFADYCHLIPLNSNKEFRDKLGLIECYKVLFGRNSLYCWFHSPFSSWKKWLVVNRYLFRFSISLHI